MQEHEYKARDKTVQKMSRDGLREENLRNKEEKRITGRDTDTEIFRSEKKEELDFSKRRHERLKEEREMEQPEQSSRKPRYSREHADILDDEQDIATDADVEEGLTDDSSENPKSAFRTESIRGQPRGERAYLETVADSRDLRKKKMVRDYAAKERRKEKETSREENLTESNKTIDGLKAKNAEYESEIESLKEQVNAYKQKEFESAGRYESISRTLLEARESADALIAQTNKECEAQHAEMTAKCEAMEKDTTDRCNALETETNAKCKQMYDETEATCASLKEQAYNDSERTRNKAHEAAEALSAKTDYECRTQKENAQKEAEAITNKATSEAYVLRKNVKKECDAVSKYMGELLAALDGVVDACCVTTTASVQEIKHMKLQKL